MSGSWLESESVAVVGVTDNDWADNQRLPRVIPPPSPDMVTSLHTRTWGTASDALFDPFVFSRFSNPPHFSR